MVTLYLDACCLNRPFDDQSQPRVRLEAEAVLMIAERISRGEWQALSSQALELEIDHNPDPGRKARAKLLLALAQRKISVSEQEEKRAKELVRSGFHAFDALHLACAESGGADVLLTTDE